MNKQTIRQAWEKVRRPLAFFCSGMIVMILAVFGMFWYYTGRATAMFEFFRTLEIIESHYAENVDRSALFDGALNGMVSTLGDKHSVYLGGELYKDFSAQMSGTYAGIGVYIGSTDDASSSPASWTTARLPKRDFSAATSWYLSMERRSTAINSKTCLSASEGRPIPASP